MDAAIGRGAQGVRRAGAAAQADAFARWLELLQAHVQLFALCTDVGAAAERLANVVLKQQPNAELLPRPRDLYSHQLVV